MYLKLLFKIFPKNPSKLDIRSISQKAEDDVRKMFIFLATKKSHDKITLRDDPVLKIYKNLLNEFKLKSETTYNETEFFEIDDKFVSLKLAQRKSLIDRFGDTSILEEPKIKIY
ncbi:hypothetical protein MXB_2856 [Myxobolus squamalis]|nr:hypothetical protein MXB_2856 [Myxobolus squamalis]